MIVLDASLATKLVIRETDSTIAHRWFLAAEGEIIAPDFISIEVAQAIVRRVNMRDISTTQGQAMLRAWRDVFAGNAIILLPTPLARLQDAAEIAMRLGHPVKDCIYLGLAIERGCDLATCDARFAEKAVRIYPAIKLLSDYMG